MTETFKVDMYADRHLIEKFCRGKCYSRFICQAAIYLADINQFGRIRVVGKSPITRGDCGIRARPPGQGWNDMWGCEFEPPQGSTT